MDYGTSWHLLCGSMQWQTFHTVPLFQRCPYASSIKPHCLHIPPASLPPLGFDLPLNSSASCCAGREDFDVRMLGSGRPFVLEIINARAAVPPQSIFGAMQAALQQVLLLRHQQYANHAVPIAAPVLCLCAALSSGSALLHMPSSTKHCFQFASEQKNGRHTQFQVPLPSLCEPLCCNVQEDHGVQVQALQSVPRSICTLLKVSLLAPVSECFLNVPLESLYISPTDVLCSVSNSCSHCTLSAQCICSSHTVT